MTPRHPPTEDPQRSGSETSNRPSEPEFLHLGRVARPHGIRGELLVETPVGRAPSLEGVERLYFGPDRAPQTLDAFRPHRKRLLVKLHGVDDRDAALRFRDQDVYYATADAEPLQPGEYYVQQLIGMRVLTEAGEALGVLVEVLATGANDVYVVRSVDDELLVPAIQDVVRSVDVEAGEMRVRLIPGLQGE